MEEEEGIEEGQGSVLHAGAVVSALDTVHTAGEPHPMPLQVAPAGECVQEALQNAPLVPLPPPPPPPPPPVEVPVSERLSAAEEEAAAAAARELEAREASTPQWLRDLKLRRRASKQQREEQAQADAAAAAAAALQAEIAAQVVAATKPDTIPADTASSVDLTDAATAIAAVKIQAAFRGHQTRKALVSERPVEQEMGLTDTATAMAAVKIQAAFRGHQTRKTLATASIMPAILAAPTPTPPVVTPAAAMVPAVAIAVEHIDASLPTPPFTLADDSSPRPLMSTDGPPSSMTADGPTPPRVSWSSPYIHSLLAGHTYGARDIGAASAAHGHQSLLDRARHTLHSLADHLHMQPHHASGRRRSSGVGRQEQPLLEAAATAVPAASALTPTTAPVVSAALVPVPATPRTRRPTVWDKDEEAEEETTESNLQEEGREEEEQMAVSALPLVDEGGGEEGGTNEESLLQKPEEEPATTPPRFPSSGQGRWAAASKAGIAEKEKSTVRWRVIVPSQPSHPHLTPIPPPPLSPPTPLPPPPHTYTMCSAVPVGMPWRRIGLFPHPEPLCHVAIAHALLLTPMPVCAFAPFSLSLPATIVHRPAAHSLALSKNGGNLAPG